MKWQRMVDITEDILKLETPLGSFILVKSPEKCWVIAPGDIWEFENVAAAKAAVERHIDSIAYELNEGIQDEE